MKPIQLFEETNRRNCWIVTADNGVSPTDLLQPSFWDRVSSRLRPGDRIRVDAVDASWLAELLVRTASRTEAKVVMLNFHDLNKLDKAAKELNEADPIEVVYKGPTLRYCVVRKSDNARLVEKLETREQAMDWIKNPPQQAQAA